MSLTVAEQKLFFIILQIKLCKNFFGVSNFLMYCKAYTVKNFVRSLILYLKNSKKYQKHSKGFEFTVALAMPYTKWQKLFIK